MLQIVELTGGRSAAVMADQAVFGEFSAANSADVAGWKAYHATTRLRNWVACFGLGSIVSECVVS